ncbi:MAG: adenosylcobinamide-GDP ribazoletransferase [Geminicoccaceae bacterium]|nr:adenosylcobinamide-GDP ribazoletransferase [Geminicoccaceae bacterium]
MLLTRLPLGTSPPGAELPAAVWAFPVVGAGLGAGAGLAFEAASSPSPLVAAFAATIFLVLLTGALHEDGLADMADGLGAGGDRARTLEIMRDSRIGTFGTLALILVVGLEVALLAAIEGAIAALVTAGALSRGCMVRLLAALPPARPDGLGARASTPPRGAVRAAYATAVLPALLFYGLAGLWPILTAVAVTLVVSRLALRRIGGQTGDVLGGVQRLAHAAVLAAILAIR